MPRPASFVVRRVEQLLKVRIAPVENDFPLPAAA
jgi:hypothetical protein